MRTLSLLACGAVLGLVVLATNARAADVPVNKLPPEISTALAKRFPNAKPVKAFTEGTDHLEVVLQPQKAGKPVGMTFEVVFKRGGYRLIEKEITVKSLPVVVTNALETKMPGAKVAKAQEVFNAKNVRIFYTLAITFKGKGGEVHITPAGKFVVEP